MRLGMRACMTVPSGNTLYVLRPAITSVSISWFSNKSMSDICGADNALSLRELCNEVGHEMVDWL